MNIPNKLTISRLLMAPLFFVVFYLPIWFGDGLSLISLVLLVSIYVLSELSDLLDGMIARRYDLVTDLGKVMDPFADALSHLTYFICFVGVGLMPVWAFVIIMWREFSIVFIRMIMMGSGKAVAANIWGKLKSVLYAIASLLGIVYIIVARVSTTDGFKSWADPLTGIFFGLSALAALASFITYLRVVFTKEALDHLTK